MTLRALSLLALGGAAFGISLAAADVTIDSRLSVYSDNNATTVVTPYVQATADVSTHGTFSAIYTADAITSASVDVVSNASKTPIHDYRNEVDLSYGYDLGDLLLSGTYIYSGEHDYQSSTGAFSAAQSFDDKNTTLALGLSYGANVVERTGDPLFQQPLDVLDVNLGWTQVVSPSLVTQVGWEFLRDSGFQSSPYRYVPIGDRAMPIAKLPESEPDLRNRQDAVAGANWALSKRVTLDGDYRYYFDDWGMQGHTLDANLWLDLAESWLLRLDGRGYVQNGAFFYQPRYDAPVAYMTTDRELSPLTEESIGAKLLWALPGFGPRTRVSVDAKIDLYWFQYSNFPLLPSRFAQVYELGLGGRY